jgi:hypothetical protein
MLVTYDEEDLKRQEAKARLEAGTDQRMFILSWFHRRWDYRGQFDVDTAPFEPGVYHFVLALRTNQGIDVQHCSLPLFVRAGDEKGTTDCFHCALAMCPVAWRVSRVACCVSCCA